MVKKLKQMADKKAANPSLFDSALASAVKESAQQIWLAGMGAFAKAQEEGGKVFEALVKEGATLQKRTQSAAEEKFGEVAGRMSSMAGDVGAKAGQHWDKLEGIFEERVAKSMARLGVPSAKDVQALSARVEALAAQVAKLGGTAPRAAKTARSAARPEAAAAKTAAAPAKKAARKAPARPAAKAARKTAAAKTAAAPAAAPDAT